MAFIENFGDALQAGAAYALLGHLADEHAEKVRQNVDVHVTVTSEAPPEDQGAPAVVVAPREGGDWIDEMVAEGLWRDRWDVFVGQEAIKEQLRVHTASAKRRGTALDHVLLASGRPGIGKTHLARIIADVMGVRLVMFVPPFSLSSLHEALRGLEDGECIFLDEVHKLADHGARGAEILLHILEERRLYIDGETIDLADITLIAATTDADKLPETIIDRFPIKPYFEEYGYWDLFQITVNFWVQFKVPNDNHERHTALQETITEACRGTPRVARELVVACRDLAVAKGRLPSPGELLEFKQLDPDGMTRKHKEYITGLYRFFPKEAREGGIEYVAGEASLMQLLRENKPGLARLERFLIERGLVDRTPRGRRLTGRGVQRAREWLEGIRTPAATPQHSSGPLVHDWLFE